MSTLINNLDWAGLLNMALRVAAVLICIMVHEVSHGLAAYLLGDPTAKASHRLTFNPLRHIDPFGALMMVVAGFGWAKPVPVDMRYFKNQKSGMAVTALAGPLSNFILAYVSLVFYFGLLPVSYQPTAGVLVPGVMDFLAMVALLSIGLGMFNLIPFPPLDGFKVLGALLPNKLYYNALRYERYGMLLLMAALWMGVLDSPLSACRDFILNLMVAGAGWSYHLVASLL